MFSRLRTGRLIYIITFGLYQNVTGKTSPQVRTETPIIRETHGTDVVVVLSSYAGSRSILLVVVVSGGFSHPPLGAGPTDVAFLLGSQ